MPNTILTTGLAAVVEVPMTDDAVPYSADPQRWPAYRFHPTLPQVCVENEEEEKALPPGYRDRPYTEEEADAWSAAQAAHEEPESHPRRHR